MDPAIQNQKLVSLIDNTYLSSDKVIQIIHANKKSGNQFLVTNHHAGNYIPEYLTKYIIADKKELINDSDKDTDKLYLATKIGGTSIVSKINRDIVDPNRSRAQEGERGVLRTTTFNGKSIYNLHYNRSKNEKEKLLSIYWDSFHSAMVLEIEELMKNHGKAIIFMGDSMDVLSPKLSYGEYESGIEKRPDIAVITRSDLSADVSIINTFFDALQSYAKDAGLKDIRKNNPWTGGGNNDFILQYYGNPEKKQHVIQIETNKKHMSTDANIKNLNTLIKRAMQETINLHLKK